MTTKLRKRGTAPLVVPFELTVLTQGVDDVDLVAYARRKIVQGARAASRPVLFGRVKLSNEPHRSVRRPARAEAMLDVDGRAVRVHVEARDLRLAIDHLEQRLRRKLKDLEHRSEFLRGFTGEVEPGAWRRADLPTRRPEYFPRPAGEREVVRRKTFAFGRLTPMEAAFEMDLLDHDFHLFVETSTGRDAVVYRGPGGRYELVRTGGPEGGSGYGVPVVAMVPPLIRLRDAVDRLNQSDEAFLFFVDATSHRGNVLYRRYDGHYGLIAPSEPIVEPA